MWTDDTRTPPGAPPVALKVIDEIVPFVAYGGRAGRCRARIYRRTDRQVILAYSAISGPPLAYACEELATQFLHRFFPGRQSDGTPIIWLEHHPPAVRPMLQAQVAAREVTFGEVTWTTPSWSLTRVSTLRRPTWRDLNQADLLAVIGELLD